MSIEWHGERLLIIAPHPDDETLGCGGLMSKARAAGAEVYIQFMTVGETEENSPKGYSSTDERFAEIKKVADFYQWSGWHVSFPGNEYHLKLDSLPRFELTNAIEKRSPVSISELRPSIVVAPHHTSYNQDHQATAQATLTALRPSDCSVRHHPRVVLAYEEAADQWRYDATMSPNLLVELNEQHLHDKIAAMRLYGTQTREHPHTRSELSLRSLAALRGMQGGSAFAEGFHVMRWLA